MRHEERFSYDLESCSTVSGKTTDKKGTKMKINARKRVGTTVAVAAAMFCAVSLTATASQTWYVDASSGNDGNDGLSDAFAYASIQKAVISSAEGDLILLNDGIYSPFWTSNKCIRIESMNGAERTIVDGRNSQRCAMLGSRGQHNTFVAGITFKNGKVETGEGGGVFGGTVSNCVIKANSAGRGGGASGSHVIDSFIYGNSTIGKDVSLDTGNLSGHGGGLDYCSVENCCVSNNVADCGGGICGGTISNTVVVANSADWYGGVEGGVLYDCTIIGNTAVNNVGGIILYSSTSSKAERCLIENNRAQQGGGCCGGPFINCVIVRNEAAENGGAGLNAVLENCSVYENKSLGSGGGCSGGAITNSIFFKNNATQNGGACLNANVVNCTICDNTAGGFGGGVYGGDVCNSIVWNNSALSTNDVCMATVRYSCASDIGTENGNIEADPLLLNAEAHDFHLADGSPCVNVGLTDVHSWESVDFDGNRRIKQGTVDMGAFEHEIDGFVGVYVKEPIGGVVSPRSGTTHEAGSLVFSAIGPRPFVGWFTNGVFVTEEPIFRWTQIMEDGVLEAKFDVDVPGNIYLDGAQGSDENAGGTIDTPYKTLGAAMKVVCDGDTIWVADGVYPPIEIPNRRIRIQSINGAANTVIDANGTDRCANLVGDTSELHMSNYPTMTNTVLSGFTLRNGSASRAGVINGDVGGAVIGGTLQDCVLTACKASHEGGGAYMSNLINCDIIENKAVGRSIFSRGWGGGGASRCRLLNCRILDNSGPSYGGGYAYGTAINCIISGNSAQNGGGGSWGTARNCTFVNNIASSQGGGVWYGSLVNCIFWNNTANVSNVQIYATLSYCCTDDAVDGEGNFVADPLFLDVLNGDYGLQANSPCVNVGLNSVVAEQQDFYGNPRISDRIVDVGAVEYQPTDIPQGQYRFEDVWGSWSIENDTEFEFPTSFNDWNSIVRFAWRARDKFVSVSEIGCMPPSDKPIIISLGTFMFSGQMVSTTGEDVQMDVELGIPVWHVRIREDAEEGIFRATVGDMEVQTAVLPSYNAQKWVECIYGTTPSWLASEELSEWYAQRARSRLELFMTLVPAANYSDYVEHLDSDEEELPPEQLNRLTIRGFAANTTTNHLHLLNIRTPAEAVVNVFGAPDLSGTNWTFHGIGSFAKGYSSAGISADSKTYFISLASGSGDADGDGISDVLETLVYGTNPYKADTNGDGLSDKEKIFHYDLDPYVSDTSGDGISDTEKVLSGVDPRLPISAEAREAVKVKIRYYYDDDDRLTDTWVGIGGASTATRLSPAGNPKDIRERPAR